MENLKSEIQLMQGEKVVMEIEAELWAASSNPVARFLGAVSRLLALLLGHKRKGLLIITDRRVIEILNIYNLWVIPTNRNVKYVIANSVKEAGYTRGATFFCFCPAYHLYYDAHTQRTSVLLKDADDAGAMKAADALYAAIANANK